MENQELIKVLYVDDEVHNLKSFKACFRKHYQIYTARSVEDARVILSVEDIHILITDQKMPAITGMQLFEEALRAYPKQTRIMLTAFADNQTILEAFQKGLVFKYVMKPWSASALKEIIDQAYDVYKINKIKETLYEEWQKAQSEMENLKDKKGLPNK